MRWASLTVGVLCVIVGTVWILQGAGILLGSVMTGQRVWLGIGIVVVFGGLFLALRGLGLRPGRP